jgi:hypothetical protein
MTIKINLDGHVERRQVFAVFVESDVLLPRPHRRRWLSLLARFRARELDSQLAAGLSAESSDLLFAHAVRIARPGSCAALASGLRKAVSAAQKPKGLSNRAPLRRGDILGAQESLFALAERLERAGPIHARGVAQVRMLLGNGSGPLYRTDGGTRLLPVLRAAAVHL